MEIKIQPFEDRYYQDIKQITFNSFALTSFHTDKQIPKEKANEITWETWCHPVLQSDKKKYCIIATHSGQAIGYIIYGAHAELSKLLNIKMGSIILLAVEKTFQSQHKIGDKLIKHVIQLFQKNKVPFITVGTDLDNLPAIINYVNNGFKPILTWATFRYYFNKENMSHNSNFNLIPLNKNSLKLPDQITRPVSFLEDNKITDSQKSKINKFLKLKIEEEMLSGKSICYHITCSSEILGFVTLIKEPTISSVLQKPFYRINDLIFFKDDITLNYKILVYFLSSIQQIYPDMAIIEIFIKLNAWDLIHILHQAHFLQVHHAMNLHWYPLK